MATRQATDELVAIPAAAAEWELSRDTIERLMRTGELEYVRVGSRRRILRSSMRDYIERHREVPRQ